MRYSAYPLTTKVVKWIIIINSIIFLIQIFGESNGISTLILWFRGYLPLYMPSSGHFYVWQLLSYQFLHADIAHIALNMFSLWIFGCELESRWGTQRFLSFYLICGIGAALAHMAMQELAPAHNMLGNAIYVPIIGASGATYGIMTAFALHFPNRPMMYLFIPIPVRAIVLVGIMIASELLKGVFGSNDGIAHLAHLGGAATSFLLVRFGERLGIFRLIDRITALFSNRAKIHQEIRQPQRIYERNSHYRESSRTEVVQQQKLSHIGTFYMNGEAISEEYVNSILEKINESGYDSLSQKEKDILKEVARRMS